MINTHKNRPGNRVKLRTATNERPLPRHIQLIIVRSRVHAPLLLPERNSPWRVESSRRA